MENKKNVPIKPSIGHVAKAIRHFYYVMKNAKSDDPHFEKAGISLDHALMTWSSYETPLLIRLKSQKKLVLGVMWRLLRSEQLYITGLWMFENIWKGFCLDVCLSWKNINCWRTWSKMKPLFCDIFSELHKSNHEKVGSCGEQNRSRLLQN